MGNERVENIAMNLQAKPGYCLDDVNIIEEIQKAKTAELEARGIQPLAPSSVTPSESTVRNYKAFLATQPNVSVSRSALVKSTTRFAAENSLRSAMSFIVTTAITHFVLSKERNAEVYKDLEKSNGVSDSSKFLFNEVSKIYNDMPIQPLERAYLLSTDDTTEFIFKGEGSKETKAHF